jgi:putative lipase involved disintegration of autophagic bodies
MKLLCTVSKILMCWKLCHETPIEDDLRQKKKYFSVVAELLVGIGLLWQNLVTKLKY